MKLSSFTAGIFKNNAVFRQFLGLCPTLAVTGTALNGFAMAAATTAVLICSNVTVSVFARFIPKHVRIPAYIVMIACFVTVIDLVMNAYFHELHQVLGLFIPLIVVNCIILGRAEAFASKNGVADSILDAFGTGLGFIIALTALGIFRELLSSGSIFGYHILPDAYIPFILMALPPGAFIALGFLMAFTAFVSDKLSKREKHV